MSGTYTQATTAWPMHIWCHDTTSVEQLTVDWENSEILFSWHGFKRSDPAFRVEAFYDGFDVLRRIMPMLDELPTNPQVGEVIKWLDAHGFVPSAYHGLLTRKASRASG